MERSNRVLSVNERQELVATWGNLANRMLSFAYECFDGKVPEPGSPSRCSAKGPDDENRALLEKIEAGFEAVGDLHNACKFRAALAREANHRRAMRQQVPEMHVASSCAKSPVSILLPG
ncbi:MAG TPA: hypothetical protein VLY63_26090 [Anaerolineae bacterium]|nr:hypothetical protein [Anaerolineae bacterium]